MAVPRLFNLWQLMLAALLVNITLVNAVSDCTNACWEWALTNSECNDATDTYSCICFNSHYKLFEDCNNICMKYPDYDGLTTYQLCDGISSRDAHGLPVPPPDELFTPGVVGHLPVPTKRSARFIGQDDEQVKRAHPAGTIGFCGAPGTPCFTAAEKVQTAQLDYNPLAHPSGTIGFCGAPGTPCWEAAEENVATVEAREDPNAHPSGTIGFCGAPGTPCWEAVETADTVEARVNPNAHPSGTIGFCGAPGTPCWEALEDEPTVQAKVDPNAHPSGTIGFCGAPGTPCWEALKDEVTVQAKVDPNAHPSGTIGFCGAPGTPCWDEVDVPIVQARANPNAHPSGTIGFCGAPGTPCLYSDPGNEIDTATQSTQMPITQIPNAPSTLRTYGTSGAIIPSWTSRTGLSTPTPPPQLVEVPSCQDGCEAGLSSSWLPLTLSRRTVATTSSVTAAQDSACPLNSTSWSELPIEFTKSDARHQCGVAIAQQSTLSNLTHCCIGQINIYNGCFQYCDVDVRDGFLTCISTYVPEAGPWECNFHDVPLTGNSNAVKAQPAKGWSKVFAVLGSVAALLRA